MSRIYSARAGASCAEPRPSIVGAGVLFREPSSGRFEQACREALQRQFPHLAWAADKLPCVEALLVDEGVWRDESSDLSAWDASVPLLKSRGGCLLLRALGAGHSAEDSLIQLLTRYQRLAPRVNEASRSEPFQRLLSLHAALHDQHKPLARTDYEHSLDVWQWVLRLEPAATLELQAAALFHDIERLSSDPAQRIEQTAPDYQALENGHAWLGAQLAAPMVRSAGIGPAECKRLAELITWHDAAREGGRDREAEVLADADALSFFSLNSWGFTDYFGPDAREKVRHSLARMSHRALGYLRQIKLTPAVREHIREAACANLTDDRSPVCA